MSWLDKFREAQDLVVDDDVATLQRKVEEAKTFEEHIAALEAYYEHMEAKVGGKPVLAHPIQNRYLHLLKIPELPDPNKDFFL